MIFVITGSQKFQFNRLLKKIDELIEQEMLQEEVFAQTGYSDYIPKNYRYQNFMGRDEFARVMEESRIVITHGGTGAIIGAVKLGKKVIAVPRLAMYKEHVDDHQVQLLTQFEEMHLICSCYELENLGEDLLAIEEEQFQPYVSNTATIIQDIEEFLNGSIRKK